MKIVTEILIFLFAALLDLIRAELFPLNLKESRIRIVMNDQRSVIESAIGLRFRQIEPERKVWIYKGEDDQPRKVEEYEAYIELPGNPHQHYGSTGILDENFGTYFKPNVHKPRVAFIHFEANQKYEAVDFAPFQPCDMYGPKEGVGEFGRLYVASPAGHFWTALLEPAQLPARSSPPRKSPSPPWPPSPTKQPGCCPLLQGWRKYK